MMQRAGGACETKQLRLGDLLLARQIVTEYDLNAALEEQKSSGVRLGKLLIHMGLIERVCALSCQSSWGSLLST